MIPLYFKAAAQREQVAGQVFNIGGGIANSLSLLELFALLEEFLGIRLEFRRLPPRESDQRVFVADLGKASRVLGWTPQVSAREGVKGMLEWVETLL